MNKKLFIAHAQSLEEDYLGLKRSLSRYYSIDDFAVWDNKRLPQSRWDDVQSRIKECGVFVLVAGAYGVNSGVIKDEIKTAKEAGLPVLVVERRSKDRSVTLHYMADEVVAWNTNEISNAVRRLSQKQ